MMSFVIPLGLLVIGTALLWICAEGLVRSSETIALRSGVSPLVTALTVVAFGTSAPELVASVAAAVTHSPDMAIGNVIGSNIANIGLVLGIAALITPIVVDRYAVRRDAPIALISTVLLIGFLSTGHLNRVEGLLLVGGILAYTVTRTRTARGLKPAMAEEVAEHTLRISNYKLALVLAGSLVGLAVGAYLFVEGARRLAELMGVSEAVIGLTIMALGTSTPEIATVIVAARKGLSDLIVGNVVGSNIFNILCVLGVAASIVPLERADIHDIDLLVFGLSAALLVGMLMRPKIGKIMGAALLAGYAAYVVFLYAS